MSQQPRPQYNQSVYASYQPESSAFTAQFLAMSPVYQLHEQPTTAIPVNVPPPNLGPDASFVTPKVASLTVQRFLSSELSKEGFLSAEAPALHRLELEVLACKQVLPDGRLWTRSHMLSSCRAAVWKCERICRTIKQSRTLARRSFIGM